MATGATSLRRVLILQGPASNFLKHLATALENRGAEISRIVFCPGDLMFWLPRPAKLFRARQDQWPSYLSTFLKAHRITDVVGLGDGRFWHASAFEQARKLGVNVHVIEQGYLRPGWLTVEPDGHGGRSRFPKNGPQIAKLIKSAPRTSDPQFETPFSVYAAFDVAYHAANLLTGALFFPHYRPHALDPPLREWRGWMIKAGKRALRASDAAHALDVISNHAGPRFLLPLQLETDFQIRHHGPKGGMEGSLRRIARSFDRHAPRCALLVMKQHPLDNGLAGWRRMTKQLAPTDPSKRILFLEDLAVETMFPHLTGVVTVNSTVGLSALRHRLPVTALGRAIYDLPGLTHKGPLSTFWKAPVAPEPQLVEQLVAALQNSIQVPGSFTGKGQKPGAEAIAAKILEPTRLTATHETLQPEGVRSAMPPGKRHATDIHACRSAG